MLLPVAPSLFMDTATKDLPPTGEHAISANVEMAGDDDLADLLGRAFHHLSAGGLPSFPGKAESPWDCGPITNTSQPSGTVLVPKLLIIAFSNASLVLESAYASKASWHCGECSLDAEPCSGN